MTRQITDKDLADARGLKRFYTAKKKALGLTQTAIADALGMKQGAVAQYMNGHIALNYGAVIRFAKLLEVDPWDRTPATKSNRSR
jgi:transcriptional regulator with XRE-family HTH domain